jgi:hypothetical protein
MKKQLNAELNAEGKDYFPFFQLYTVVFLYYIFVHKRIYEEISGFTK